MGSYTTGRTMAMQKLSYEKINDLRAEKIDANAFSNILRGRPGLKTTFDKVMPPVVKKGDIRLGCGKLDDPTCMTKFEFTAEITKQRYIDEISNPCDISKLEASELGGYYADAAAVFSIDEVKDIVYDIWNRTNDVGSTTIEIEESDNIYTITEKMIQAYLKKSYEELGAYASKRKDLIILYSPEATGELRVSKLECCDIANATVEGNENFLKVKGVYEMDYTFVPQDMAGQNVDILTDIIVYDPRRHFTVTTCENDPSIQSFNAPGYEPNSIRMYGSEMYGFQSLEYPRNNGGALSMEKATLGFKYKKEEIV